MEGRAAISAAEAGAAIPSAAMPTAPSRNFFIEKTPTFSESRMCFSFNIQNFTKKYVTQVQHTGFHAGTTGRLSLKSPNGMIRRAPALPATNAGRQGARQGARHVTETRHFAG